MLYLLILTDIEMSYDNHSEDFFIGVFETKEQAEKTAKYYLENVRGFCDFNCIYHILKKEVIGKSGKMIPDKIWLITGWNINGNYDETDIIESSCFSTEEAVYSELQVMKSKYKCSEWSVDCYKINEMNWREGFCRIK